MRFSSSRRFNQLPLARFSQLNAGMHVSAVFAALLSLVLVRPGGGDGEHPPRPPREALEACEEMEAGDACAFQGRNDETVEGTCFTPGDDKPLACRPSDPPPRKDGGGRGS